MVSGTAQWSLLSALWWPKCAYITQLCLTLWDCMDYTPPGSSVHGICQTMISDSRRSSWPRDQMYISCISCIGKWFFTTELPKWERNLFFGYMYMCNWFTLLYCRNSHNIVKKLYLNKINRKLKKKSYVNMVSLFLSYLTVKFSTFFILKKYLPLSKWWPLFFPFEVQ